MCFLNLHMDQQLGQWAYQERFKTADTLYLTERNDLMLLQLLWIAFHLTLSRAISSKHLLGILVYTQIALFPHVSSFWLPLRSQARTMSSSAHECYTTSEFDRIHVILLRDSSQESDEQYVLLYISFYMKQLLKPHGKRKTFSLSSISTIRNV
jgi:hypothetical protein